MKYISLSKYKIYFKFKINKIKFNFRFLFFINITKIKNINNQNVKRNPLTSPYPQYFTFRFAVRLGNRASAKQSGADPRLPTVLRLLFGAGLRAPETPNQQPR